MNKDYRKDIGFTPPGLKISESFGKEFADILDEYHSEIWSEGVILLKYRYLIALATAIVEQNEKRAKLELVKAIKHGASKEELFEVLKQQIWMKGAPTLVWLAPLIKIIEDKFNLKNPSE